MLAVYLHIMCMYAIILWVHNFICQKYFKFIIWAYDKKFYFFSNELFQLCRWIHFSSSEPHGYRSARYLFPLNVPAIIFIPSKIKIIF
jgi:hypothetical protein